MKVRLLKNKLFLVDLQVEQIRERGKILLPRRGKYFQVTLIGNSPFIVFPRNDHIRIPRYYSFISEV